jgi:dephospho-CoA kinase
MISSAAMILVGLTGGVATGKTTVGKMFKQCGCTLINADELAREVVRPGSQAWREIVKTFGKSILNPDQTLDRHALGAIVFRHPARRRALERIIHPRVARLQAKLMQRAAKHNPQAVIIYEVPLLFEAGVDKRVDRIVVVTADRETQIIRLKRRNGLTRAEALRRIKSQLALSRKIARADIVLDGTLCRPLLRAEVRKLHRAFQRLA